MTKSFSGALHKIATEVESVALTDPGKPAVEAQVVPFGGPCAMDASLQKFTLRATSEAALKCAAGPKAKGNSTGWAYFTKPHSQLQKSTTICCTSR